MVTYLSFLEGTLLQNLLEDFIVNGCAELVLEGGF